MMKDQKIIASSKGELMAAFECAKGYPGNTNVLLKRSTGETIYRLRPFSLEAYKDLHPKFTAHLSERRTKEEFDSKVQKAKNKIRQIKEKDLLY